MGFVRYLAIALSNSAAPCFGLPVTKMPSSMSSALVLLGNMWERLLDVGWVVGKRHRKLGKPGRLRMGLGCPPIMAMVDGHVFIRCESMYPITRKTLG